MIYVDEIRKALKKIMKVKGLSVIDVAAGTKIYPTTITRFLGGTKPHGATKAQLELFIKIYERHL